MSEGTIVVQRPSGASRGELVDAGTDAFVEMPVNGTGDGVERWASEYSNDVAYTHASPAGIAGFGAVPASYFRFEPFTLGQELSFQAASYDLRIDDIPRSGTLVTPRLKRLMDIVGAATALLLCAPLLCVIAAAIRLDSKGGIFFGHKRIGKGGRVFRAWKFRTMVPDAEATLSKYLRLNPHHRETWEREQKLRDDPRVTRVGRWLRRTSLDELPQLWNVLTGEMSLVGPRPIITEEVWRYGDSFHYYTSVSPGITGLWQVSGRNNTTYEERVSLDTSYVRNRSLHLDLSILFRTVGVVLRCEGAY